MQVLPRNVSWAAATLAIGLAACGVQGPVPDPGPGPQPEPPTGASALVIEAVDSSVYDELAERVTMVPYDGSQKAEEHDLVILDGDAHAPEAVATHPLVAEAVDAGTAVLLLDATGAHKRDGLEKPPIL